MASFVCPICEEIVQAGKQHKCKPKPIPYNVLNDKKDNKFDPDRGPFPKGENKFA